VYVRACVYVCVRGRYFHRYTRRRRAAGPTRITP